MATTTGIATKELVKYRVEDGIAIFELDDAPANTYTHEMMRDLDSEEAKVLIGLTQVVAVKVSGGDVADAIGQPEDNRFASCPNAQRAGGRV